MGKEERWWVGGGSRWGVNVLLSRREAVVRTGEKLRKNGGDAYQTLWCLSNDTPTARSASTGLELNREILLLAGGGCGGGKEGEEGIHLS